MLDFQCQYHDSKGRRCPAKAAWRLSLSPSDPFALAHVCSLHASYYQFVYAMWIESLGPEKEKLFEGEGAD